MTRPSRAGAVVVAGFCLSLVCLPLAYPQAPPSVPKKATTMTKRASGTFEVKLSPQAPDDKSEASTVGSDSLQTAIERTSHVH